MIKHVNGEMSKNFPLYHTSLIPIYQPIEKKYSQGKKTMDANFYTNETPDFFRLDSMKLSGYRNPYLDGVLKVDRNEQLNKMNLNADQINLIDYIKSNRKFSQDPKILRYIRNEFDIEMEKKRQQISEDRKKKKVENAYIININDINNYDKIIQKLDKYTPRINYKMKRTIDPDENRKNIGKFLTSEENYNKLKQLTCDFNPHKSAYITNSNDYKIKEANGRDRKKELSYERRVLTQLNLINSKKEKIKPPKYINEKWSPFYENFYMTLINNKKGFSQKGGLFTEFTNKNIGTININKRNNKEKLLKEKKDLHFRDILFGNNNDTKKKQITYDTFKRSNSIKYNFVGLNRNMNNFGYQIK